MHTHNANRRQTQKWQQWGIEWNKTIKDDQPNILHIKRRSPLSIRANWLLVLRKARWNTLIWHYKYRLATFVHKSIHSETPLSDLFTKKDSVYSMRGRNKLDIPRPRTDIVRNSITYRASVLWNYLDESLQEQSHAKFKKLVKEHISSVPLRPNIRFSKHTEASPYLNFM